MNNNLSTSPVLVSLISALGGIAIAYITYILSQRVQTKRAARQPRDRMEQMFDGYERLIKAKDIEDERKNKTINTLEIMVKQLETELEATKKLLSTTRIELQESKAENIELRKSLKELRKTYDTIKRQDTRQS